MGLHHGQRQRRRDRVLLTIAQPGVGGRPQPIQRPALRPPTKQQVAVGMSSSPERLHDASPRLPGWTARVPAARRSTRNSRRPRSRGRQHLAAAAGTHAKRLARVDDHRTGQLDVDQLRPLRTGRQRHRRAGCSTELSIAINRLLAVEVVTRPALGEQREPVAMRHPSVRAIARPAQRQHAAGTNVNASDVGSKPRQRADHRQRPQRQNRQQARREVTPPPTAGYRPTPVGASTPGRWGVQPPLQPVHPVARNGPQAQAASAVPRRR